MVGSCLRFVGGSTDGYSSNAKIRFQSFFMLITTQPCFLASFVQTEHVFATHPPVIPPYAREAVKKFDIVGNAA